MKRNKFIAFVLSAAIVVGSLSAFPCEFVFADENDETLEEPIEEIIPDDPDDETGDDGVTTEEVIDEDYDIASVAINSTNFPDANFRSFVSDEFDTDSNGVLSEEELRSVNTLRYFNGTSGDVSEFTGIEFFPNLTSVILSSFLITDFDASVLPNVYNLHLALFNLENVNLRSNEQLHSLHITSNVGLDSLDLSSNVNLEYIYIDRGSPARLDISMCPRLIENLDNPVYEYRVNHNLGIAGYASQNEPDHGWTRFGDDPWYWISCWDAYTTTVDLGDRVITPVPRPSVNMYRLYNPNSGEHFYTANAGERNHLISLGWNDEGIGWVAPASSNTPVYRLYNQNGGEHHYTTSTAERDMLLAAGWNDEGIGWYSDDARTVPLYRQYNPNAFANNHNYTTSLSENNWLVSIGWQAEGIGWYGTGTGG